MKRQEPGRRLKFGTGEEIKMHKRKHDFEFYDVIEILTLVLPQQLTASGLFSLSVGQVATRRQRRSLVQIPTSSRVDQQPPLDTQPFPFCPSLSTLSIRSGHSVVWSPALATSHRHHLLLDSLGKSRVKQTHVGTLSSAHLGEVTVKDLAVSSSKTEM